jgi:hypothetical protein
MDFPSVLFLIIADHCDSVCMHKEIFILFFGKQECGMICIDDVTAAQQ